MDKDLIHDIAEQIYSLFVVNTAAAGIQQKDGIYITEYIPVTPFLIENMVLAKGSMGCYQQGYKTGYLKWICLDFDCKDKINPDVKKLHNEVIAPVTDFLNKNSIRYLTEFSGRRGIHVWIVFDHIIEKSLGFRILNEILRNVPFEGREEGNWGLDKFPTTDSSKNNTVGKQVKFPLSTHRAGGIFLLPITVCAAMAMYGSASATIENRKGICIFTTEEPVADGLTSTLDSGADSTELFSTPDYESIVEDPESTLVFDSEENLIVDDLIVEVQDLADTLLTEELREE